MFGLARSKLVAVAAAAALALSPMAALAHPAGGFRGGGFHGGFHGGGFHGGFAPHGPAFHGGGNPHWQGPPPYWHNGPHGGVPRGPGPVRAPHGQPWHGGPPPHWHGPPPPHWHGPPPPNWGPYYGPAALGPYWYGPPYGPYGPGWGWNGTAWVPFAAGALIGGGVVAATNNGTVNTATTPTINPKHYQWCEDHYKSYRVSDNTYQPYHGPRQQCVSPYY